MTSNNNVAFRWPFLGAALIAVSLAASPALAEDDTTATDEAAAAEDNTDPLEPLNRTISGFNRFARGLLIDPLIETYKGLAPPPVQETISNVTSNLAEPVTAVSSVLQGDTENAGNAASRFLVNTTVGLGGTNDVATDMGIESREEDLGQAMGANGVAAGPHIVLPIIGPSNMRDATGDILTAITNPLPLAATAAKGSVDYAEKKDDIKAATDGALDPYVVERDGYEQHREFQVKNGEVDMNDVPTVAAGE